MLEGGFLYWCWGCGAIGVFLFFCREDLCGRRLFGVCSGWVFAGLRLLCRFARRNDRGEGDCVCLGGVFFRCVGNNYPFVFSCFAHWGHVAVIIYNCKCCVLCGLGVICGFCGVFVARELHSLGTRWKRFRFFVCLVSFGSQGFLDYMFFEKRHKKWLRKLRQSVIRRWIF